VIVCDAKALDDAPAPSARQLRILLIVESAAGGTGRHVLDLAEGLMQRGVEVHLIHSTRRIDPMFRDRLAALKSLHILPLPLRTSPHPTDWKMLRALRRYRREFGPFDLVHGHSSKGGALARLTALGTGIPVVYTLHGLIMMDPCLPRWKWLLYLSIELGLSLRTARIIAVSPEEARAAMKLGLGRSRVILVPNGIGPMELSPRDQARRDMNVADNACMIGFVGRLVEQKAPQVLLEAFAIASRAVPRCRLALVGAGPLEASLRALAERLNIAEQIIWLGERDARQVLAGFDLFALSSRKEGLPYVVLEAMAAGLPVVATASAGVEILIEPKITGEVVPTDDISAFARALIGLASDPVRLANVGLAARQRAEQFTLDAMVDRTLAAYRACAGEVNPCESPREPHRILDDPELAPEAQFQ
jgi:glycosyltransferase involved in cell wall biosynthesis